MRKLLNKFIKWFAFFFTDSYKHRFVSNYPIRVKIYKVSDTYFAYREPEKHYGDKKPVVIYASESKEELIDAIKIKWPFAMIEK